MHTSIISSPLLEFDLRISDHAKIVLEWSCECKCIVKLSNISFLLYYYKHLKPPLLFNEYGIHGKGGGSSRGIYALGISYSSLIASVMDASGNPATLK